MSCIGLFCVMVIFALLQESAAVVKTYFKILNGEETSLDSIGCGRYCAKRGECSGFILDGNKDCQLQTAIPIETVCDATTAPCYKRLSQVRSYNSLIYLKIHVFK